VIDTHWHFDHTDNNAALHAAGLPCWLTKYEEANGEAHDLPVFGLHFEPSPAEALPQETFTGSKRPEG